MNKRTVLFLGLMIFFSCLVGFFTLTRGQPWWDDFAGYLLQTRSILSWTMVDFIRQNTFTIQNSSFAPGPVAYPWGYPLLLTPVYALLGLNPLALKLVSLLFYGISLVSMYILARSRLAETESLLVTGVFAFLPAMIAANDQILSDIPFLALSTISLVLIERYGYQQKMAGIACGAAIFAAFFLRTNGILLIAPLLVSLLISTGTNWLKGIKKAVPPLVTFGLLAILQAVVFPGGQGSYFSHFNLFSPQRLLDNILYYLWLPASAFDQIPGGVVLYPLVLIFSLISLSKNLVRDAALHSYGLLTVLLFMVWPERQGLRFIYPILPFMLVAAFDGMLQAVAWMKTGWRTGARRVVAGVWGLLLVTSLGISTLSAYQITSGGRQINGPFDQYSYQMYDFIRQETPATSVIIFMRPRALRLFTDRQSFMTDQCQDLIKGDYVVIHLKMEGNGQIPPEKIDSCGPALFLKEEFQNKRFIVYKLKP